METNLIEAEALTTRVPREGSQEGVQLLRDISKTCEVLTKDDNYVRAHFLCFTDELQFA